MVPRSIGLALLCCACFACGNEPPSARTPLVPEAISQPDASAHPPARVRTFETKTIGADSYAHEASGASTNSAGSGAPARQGPWSPTPVFGNQNPNPPGPGTPQYGDLNPSPPGR